MLLLQKLYCIIHKQCITKEIVLYNSICTTSKYISNTSLISSY